MKRKILISTLLLLTGLVTHAQDLDIKPSQQAQGILESKNAMVDHATGLFHYKVPLYEIKSGNFTLPISLDYVAKGVKVQDKPGLIGYNWTLNTGGVVTRTIRGGIADEIYEIGYIYNNVNKFSLLDSINKREIDGEMDIFTASFNGQSLHFFIKLQNDNIVAVPLERTNVKIECDQNLSYWIITDESGNKFTFNVIEYSGNIIQASATSHNIIEKHSSSWYLSKIEPLNAEPIIYKYSKINEASIYLGNITTIKYGQPIFENKFNFTKYESEFNMCINEAKDYLRISGMEASANQGIAATFFLASEFKNYDWKYVMDHYTSLKIQDDEVLGMLTKFGKVSSISSDLIKTLDNLERTYKSRPESSAQQAGTWFGIAKKLMIDCIKEQDKVYEKKMISGSSLLIKSPLLSSIECMDKTVKFDYCTDYQLGYTLKKVSLHNNFHKLIGSVYVNESQISYYDKDNQEVDRIQFEYLFPSIGTRSDMWGFNTRNDKDGSIIDTIGVKKHLLHRIIKKNNNVLELDYEPNKIRRGFDDCNFNYGGTRLKSIIINDGDIANCIRYRYPVDGESMIRKEIDSEYIRYQDQNFSDEILYQKIISLSDSYLNTGNNGVYYPYVEEEFVGKGTNTYYFCAPLRDGTQKGNYAYWLNGLPLGRAVYDLNGYLKSLSKNIYYTDYSIFRDNKTRNDTDWFVDSDNLIKYSSSLPQVTAYRNYVDKEKLEQEFANKDDVVILERYYSINPYNDVYVPNIKPRTNVVLPDHIKQKYDIRYGGKTLIKEQIEYIFEGNEYRTPSPVHFTDLSITSSNKNRVEYFYDNLSSSVYPTRISVITPSGDEYMTIIRRITDVSDNAYPVIEKMKQNNIYADVIKHQKLYKNSSSIDYLLLDENISLYKENVIEGKSYFLQDKIYSYDNPNKKNVNSFINGIDTNLFSYSVADYKSDKSIEYQYHKNSWLPSIVNDNLNKEVFVYDLFSQSVILHSPNSDCNMLSAVDYNRTKDMESIVNSIIDIKEDYHCLKETYPRLFHNYSDSYKEYKENDEFIQFAKLINEIISEEKTMSYLEYKELCRATFSTYSYVNFIDTYATAAKIPAFDKTNLEYALSLIRRIEKDTYNNSTLCEVEDLSKIAINKDAVSVTTIPSYKRIKLFYYGQVSNSLVCNIIHSGGTANVSIPMNSSSFPKLYIATLDLSSYDNISCVKMNYSSRNTASYVAIVPVDTEFEAMSYNADGTVFCKFNQNGQLERYEYDAAGRVVKVYDNDNNVLKEFKYNVVL